MIVYSGVFIVLVDSYILDMIIYVGGFLGFVW